MEQGLITCPNCGHEFEMSDAIAGKIRTNLKAEMQKEVARREAEVNKRARALREEQDAIAKSRETLEELVEERLKKRLAEAEHKAIIKLENKYNYQLKDLLVTVKERDEVISTFREQELELRKKQRKLDEEKEAVELEITRKIDEERLKIREEASKKTAEEHRLKDLEKDKIIADLRVSLEDMKRKTEQGSMETQGEVFEQDFEGQLRNFFLHDDIRPVPKGIRGADIVQIVRTPLGVECGILLWEAKNTKTWSNTWIPKLKDDMIEIRATIGILVSVVLPDSLGRFGSVEGIWVSEPLSAIPLAAALREQLIAVNHERATSVGKNEKMEALYQYLAGSEFKQKIEAIVDAFTFMQDQLNQERRVMEKQWKQREKQLERVIKNTVGLYGDMQGIIGGQIPTIPALELDDKDMLELPGPSDSNSNPSTGENRDEDLC